MSTSPKVLDSSAALYVAEVGSGPPLLLINGIGLAVRNWQPLAAQLSRERRLIMFDAPGTGRSPELRRPLRMPGLARLVTDLLDRLGHEVVDVLGYSWGGALALQLAHEEPHRVRRLVLAATTPGLGGQLPAWHVMALASSPLQYLSPTYRDRIAPIVFGGSNPGVADVLDAPVQLRGYVQQLFAISCWSSLAWLHRLPQETLVLSGTNDPLVPARNAELLAERIPRGELRLVPGAGHLWLLQHAAAGAVFVDEFLGRASASD